MPFSPFEDWQFTSGSTNRAILCRSPSCYILPIMCLVPVLRYVAIACSTRSTSIALLLAGKFRLGRSGFVFGLLLYFATATIRNYCYYHTSTGSPPQNPPLLPTTSDRQPIVYRELILLLLPLWKPTTYYSTSHKKRGYRNTCRLFVPLFSRNDQTLDMRSLGQFVTHLRVYLVQTRDRPLLTGPCSYCTRYGPFPIVQRLSTPKSINKVVSDFRLGFRVDDQTSDGSYRLGNGERRRALPIRSPFTAYVFVLSVL